MKTHIKLWSITLISIFCTSIFSCTKKIDIKPNQAMLVPETLQDFQAMIDNDATMNINYPINGEAGSDNLYILDARFNALALEYAKNQYIWAKEMYTAGDLINDWNYPFIRIYLANAILENLPLKIQNKDSKYNSIFGSALFFRGYSYFSLSQIFCKPYSSNASSDLGLPLKKKADINEKSSRSNLQETYNQIIADLKTSIPLLEKVAVYKTRPSKAAGYGLLSRVYLEMENYEEAFKYADSALNLYSNLIDYNSLSTTATDPFKSFNEEVIFHATLGTSLIINATNTSVDTELFNSYDQNDLRKSIFFIQQSTGLKTFKGNYSGNTFLFGGIATDELFLIRAECFARKGETNNALRDLNILLKKRWRNTVLYPEITASNPEEALSKVLIERRKELVFRGQRWSDLRRLNKDPRFAKTLSRTVNGISYTLPPNDLRYVYPIPTDEIILSGLQQNDR